MRFSYKYKTSDGVIHAAEISAANKDSVYALLKKQGIRPFCVNPAPGFFNFILGHIRSLIVGLVFVLLVTALVFETTNVYTAQDQDTVQEEELSMDDAIYELRAQIYGDPAVLSVCEAASWTNVFDSATDRILAQFAIPGRIYPIVNEDFVLDATEQTLTPVVPDPSDYKEIAQMKRMVNMLKRELSEYLSDGGTISGYCDRLKIRQHAEYSIYQRARKELQRTRDYEDWKIQNAKLRAMGLPMVSEEDVLGEKK